jgi:glyoxylase-like metal-dependent hydrolase (beta-lactamase superfamily II)
MQILDRLHAFLWQSPTTNNCNTYFIQATTPVLIDPGHAGLFDHVQRGLREIDVDLDDIRLVISTHAHPDHIEAVQLFPQESTRCALHELEWQMITAMEKEITMAFDIQLEAILPDVLLTEGDLIAGDLELQVIHTPGHSPGSVVLYWAQEKALFTGDLIFRGGVGRTDLPGGDGPALKQSIKRLTELEIEWIRPGHGDIVSGNAEVKANFNHIEQVFFNYI